MCPKIDEGICEVAGIGPCHVECADEDCCYSDNFEKCRLYLLEALMKCRESIHVLG